MVPSRVGLETNGSDDGPAGTCIEDVFTYTTLLQSLTMGSQAPNKSHNLRFLRRCSTSFFLLPRQSTLPSGPVDRCPITLCLLPHDTSNSLSLANLTKALGGCFIIIIPLPKLLNLFPELIHTVSSEGVADIGEKPVDHGEIVRCEQSVSRHLVGVK